MDLRFSEDERFAAWKITLLQSLVGATFFVLLVGYWRLQIGQHRQFLEQAERNRIRNLPIIAPRGRILDREGRVLVDNGPAFDILLMRDTPGTIEPAKLEGLIRALDLDPAEVSRLIESSARLPRFQPIILKQTAELEDVSFVESHRSEFPEIAIIDAPRRVYPNGALAAATFGYVGEVSPEIIAQPGSHYRPGDVVGVSGIERTYDLLLAGRDGMRRVIVNSRGEDAGSMNAIESLPGNDLRLTFDLDLQIAAENALGDRQGAVVAFDPRTGEVLAMVSHPNYDPNDFAKRIGREAWMRLTSNAQKPLMNKAIQAHLAPGSVFKIFTAAAALETGTIKPSFTVYCPGVVNIYGHTYHDWVWGKTQGHGYVDLHRAIVVSCDVYFYTLGKLLGIDPIAFFAKHLGLGSKTGIDLPSEDPGLVPSPEWVEARSKRQWYLGETISVAIGQGAVAVTPVQLAYALGGIASGGVFRQPHLAFRNQLLPLQVKVGSNDPHNFPLKPQTVEILTRGMWGAVNEGGTGASARSAGLDIAGKTGTAQVVSQELRQSSHSTEYKNNAWFVGFSPSVHPEIVVSALVIQGEHSAVAAPIARDVIKAFYDKRQARKPADQTQTQVRLLSKMTQGRSGAGGVPR